MIGFKERMKAALGFDAYCGSIGGLLELVNASTLLVNMAPRFPIGLGLSFCLCFAGLIDVMGIGYYVYQKARKMI